VVIPTISFDPAGLSILLFGVKLNYPTFATIEAIRGEVLDPRSKYLLLLVEKGSSSTNCFTFETDYHREHAVKDKHQYGRNPPPAYLRMA